MSVIEMLQQTGICWQKDLILKYLRSGAATRTRTADLRFTKPLLYQLSYCGAPRLYDIRLKSGRMQENLIRNNYYLN